MDNPGAYNIASICAGVGGLDLGVSLARPDARVVVYIEREAHACEVLAARMESGEIPAAPIWSDLATFDPNPWCRVVDLVTSGDPCQPNSDAGKRKGKDDDRWLLDHVLRVVEGLRPATVFRENVPGNLAGQLGVIVPGLERLGHSVAGGIFSAQEVGATHDGARLYVMGKADGSGGKRHEKEPRRRPIRRTASHGASRGVLPPLFAPPPESAEWEGVVSRWPDLEPAPRRDDLRFADRLDEIRAGGNAVCPLAAALAYATLEATLCNHY